MAPVGPDASNSCLPPASPVVVSVPPVPSPTRGERCVLEGRGGRINQDKAVLAYHSGKLVVTRNLDNKPLLPDASPLPVLTYRGHLAPVSALKLSPSGAYMASGDERGILRVWAFDHPEHLCKYDKPSLTGPIRDLDWDGDSKRIALAGERSGDAASGECARVLQWDTGVTVGQLALHLKGRASSVTMKPNRPFRIVTAGKDDTKTYFHQGPPFAKVPPQNGVPADMAHRKGTAVTCVRYNHAGTLVASVSSDRSICLYDGKTLEFKSQQEQAHAATIYAVAWSGDDQHVLTASGDGTCKLWSVSDDVKLQQVHEWKPAEHQLDKPIDKVPIGGTQLGCTFVQGTRPVSVGLNGQISLLPLPESKNEIQVLTGHYAPIAGLAVGGPVFYTGDSDGILCQWDLTTSQPTRRLEPPNNDNLMYTVHGGAISGLACLKDGTLLSVGWDDQLYVTDPTTGQVGAKPLSLSAQPSAIAAGSKVAVICTVQGLLLFQNGKLSSMISIPYTAQAVCVTQNDQTAMVGGDDCKIHIYNIANDTLKEVHVIDNGHLKPIHAMALSPDETKLASGDDRDVCVWNLQDYSPLIARGRWCFHVQKVTCLSWSPDSQVIASGGADDSIYLWSLKNKMKRIHYPYAHRGGLTGLHFLQDSSSYKFVSVGVDAVVNQWDVGKNVKEKFG